MDFKPTNQECLRLKYHKKCAGETVINQMKKRFEAALRQKTEMIAQLERELIKLRQDRPELKIGTITK